MLGEAGGGDVAVDSTGGEGAHQQGALPELQLGRWRDPREQLVHGLFRDRVGLLVRPTALHHQLVGHQTLAAQLVELAVDLGMGGVPDETHRSVEVVEQVVPAEETVPGQQGQQRVLQRHGFRLDTVCEVTLCAAEHCAPDCICRSHIETGVAASKAGDTGGMPGFGETVMAAYESAARMLFAASLLASAAPVHAVTLLTAAKVGQFDRAPDGTRSASVRVTNDPGLVRLADPRCPAASAVAFGSASQSQVRTDSGDTKLPCEHWSATRRGFRYQDPAGSAAGVQEIVYERHRLRIRAGGPRFAAIAGPVIYVEAFLAVGEQRYLVRFYDFRVHQPDQVGSRRPPRLAAAGEAAFWETLRSWSPDTDRPLRLLRGAVDQHPKDGRSQFYLGAFHVYLAASAPSTPSGLQHLSAAQEPLDRAVDLLPHD